MRGGAYLGLCAGAYYGCSPVVFEPGSALQVVGDRELRFFPGTGEGAAYAGAARPVLGPFLLCLCLAWCAGLQPAHGKL